MSFVFGKLAWLVIGPANLMVLLTGLGAVLLMRGHWRWGRRLVVAAAVLGLAVSALPLGTWLLLPLENRFPANPPLPDAVDGIILLEGVSDPAVSAARGQPAVGDAVERLAAFALLARLYPQARLVVGGGSGRLRPPGASEAEIAGTVLAGLGVAPVRLELEDQARNTLENALLSRDKVRPRRGEVWLLVTSAAHMPRAVGTFRAAGWPVLAYPVDYRTTGTLTWTLESNAAVRFAVLSQALHEWAGLIFYRLAGCTDSWFPGPAPP